MAYYVQTPHHPLTLRAHGPRLEELYMSQDSKVIQ
jgi:hypothetical protein